MPYGLAGGGVVVTVMALVYSQSPALFLSPLFQWSLLLLYGVAMALSLLRRPQLSRSEATRTALTVFVLVSASYYLYTYLLYEVFDPTLYELQSELMIENAERYATGTPGKFEETPAELYSVERLRYTPGGVLFNFALGCLSGAAVSYLLGLALGYREPGGEQAREPSGAY